MRIGISCYPSVGGSGILATTLGLELAARGHEVHFIAYERPFRLEGENCRVQFHPVIVNDYGLFRYPDYTLPLSVKMAEVACAHRLDVLHVHYAVPHATAALLARSMLGPAQAPAVVTTLHGTDTTLLGHDPGYRPAIRHALERSDALTAVSRWLADETRRVIRMDGAIDVIPNFFVPRPPARPAAEVRAELGLAPGEALIVHASNLRPLKRVDLVLAAFARVRSPAKLLVLAGDAWRPTHHDDRVIIRERVERVEDYLQIADVSLTASDSESFCLAILEAMFHGCPAVSTRVGGIPEVVEDGATGLLVEPGDAAALSAALEALASDAPRRRAMGAAARERARALFSAERVVPLYEALYERHVRRPPPP